MLTMHGGAAEEPKLAQRRNKKTINVKHTLAIGPTVSMICLIELTALFHDFTMSIASSAVLTAAVREELAFVDTAIVKRSVASSVECRACSSAWLKTILSSVCTAVS
jgi:hypothetical protein